MIVVCKHLTHFVLINLNQYNPRKCSPTIILSNLLILILLYFTNNMIIWLWFCKVFEHLESHYAAFILPQTSNTGLASRHIPVSHLKTGTVGFFFDRWLTTCSVWLHFFSFFFSLQLLWNGSHAPNVLDYETRSLLFLWLQNTKANCTEIELVKNYVYLK